MNQLLVAMCRQFLFNGGITPSGARRMDLFKLAIDVVYDENGDVRFSSESR